MGRPELRVARARDKLVQLMSVMALSLTPNVTAGPTMLTMDVSASAGVAGLSYAVHAGTVATPSLASMLSAGPADPLRALITTPGGGGWVRSGEPSESSHSSLWQAVYTSEESRTEAFDLSDGFVQIVGVGASGYDLFEVAAPERSQSDPVGGFAMVRHTGYLDRGGARAPPPPSTPLPSAGMLALAGLALLGARRRR